MQAKVGSTRDIRLVRTAVLIGLLALPAAALAVDVRGTLTIPSGLSARAPETDAERSRARYWEEWNGVLEPRSPRFDASAELAVVLTGPGPAISAEQPALRVRNGSLFPATLVARAGTPVSIRNEDGCSYELYAEGASEFGPIQTAPGNARPITIAEPGNWPVRDRAHGHVRGHLHVLRDLVASAFVEPNGNYSFRGVPAGTYRLHVFLGPREVVSEDVTIADGATFQVPAVALSPR